MVIILLLLTNIPTKAEAQIEEIEIHESSISMMDIESTGLEWLHNQGYNGTNVRIGIMDNGVDFLHDAYAQVNYTEKSFIERSMYKEISEEGLDLITITLIFILLDRKPE